MFVIFHVCANSRVCCCVIYSYRRINVLCQEKKCLWTCAKMCRFKSFCVCAKYDLGLCTLFIHSIGDGENPDQTAWMGRLIWAYPVSICPKTHFRMAQSKMSVLFLPTTVDNCTIIFIQTLKEFHWNWVSLLHLWLFSLISLAFL